MTPAFPPARFFLAIGRRYALPPVEGGRRGAVHLLLVLAAVFLLVPFFRGRRTV